MNMPLFWLDLWIHMIKIWKSSFRIKNDDVYTHVRI